jgi:anti-sigma B factor antagonist
VQARRVVTAILSISVSAGPAHTLLRVAGECDITTAPQLLEAFLTQRAAAGRLVVVDLSALSYLDVAGTRALLTASTALAGPGRSLAVAAPQRIVARMLELTCAACLIPVYVSVAEALIAG